MNYFTESFTADEVIEYLRKSRSDDPALSVEEVLAKHEKILNEYAENHLGGLVPDAQIYREVASSETIDGRPEMLKLLQAVESPAVKAVLVVDVQRLSRGDLEDAGRLIKLLRYTGTFVITPYKTYDLRDDFDRDAFERELKRGNEYLEYFKKIQARGRLASVQEGNFIGSIPPYGYDKVFVTVGKKKCPTLQENREQADVVRMIFDLYVNQDMGYKRICNHLDALHIAPPKGNYWSPAALKDMLANVHYIGKVKWNQRQTVNVVENQEVKKTRPKSDQYEIYEGRHEGIISEELFLAAREKQGQNHRAKADTKIRNPFASVLYCQCGRAMSYRTYKNSDGSSQSVPRLLCDGQTHCGNGSVSYNEMVNRVSKILEDCISDFEIKLQNNKNQNQAHLQNNLIRNLEKKLQELEARELSQWEAWSDPDPDKRMPAHIFKILNEKTVKEKEEVKQALQQVHESIPEPIDYAEKIVLFREARNALLDPNTPAEAKNRYLKSVFIRLEYSRIKPVRVTRKEAVILGMDVENAGRTLWYSPAFELNVKLRI